MHYCSSATSKVQGDNFDTSVMRTAYHYCLCHGHRKYDEGAIIRVDSVSETFCGNRRMGWTAGIS